MYHTNAVVISIINFIPKNLIHHILHYCYRLVKAVTLRHRTTKFYAYVKLFAIEYYLYQMLYVFYLQDHFYLNSN